MSDREGAPGWDAIDEALRALYGDQEPKHFGTLIRWRMGGPDPLDGVSIYSSDAFGVPHWHYVSYGLTELYHKETQHADVSGWGFELTMRLRRTSASGPPMWPVTLMQGLARYVFKTGRGLEPNDHMDARGPITGSAGTKLVSMLFTRDLELAPRTTPHGRMQFVQIVGATADELMAAQSWSTQGMLDELARVSPGLVVDLNRKSARSDPAFRARVAAGIAADGSSMGVALMPKLAFGPSNGDFVLSIDAGAVELLTAVLPGRLGFGRPLTLVGEHDGAALVLVPGEDVSYRAPHADASGGDRPTLSLPAAAVVAFAEQVKATVGKYRLAPGLAVVITKPAG